MATDQPSTQASVSDLAELCMLSFQDCLQQSATLHPRELSLSEDQLGRFSLWANSIGVFAPGRASMDHRLREAPEIIEIVAGLLDGLKYSINSCSATLKSTYESQKAHLDRDDTTSAPNVDRSRQAIANQISLLYRFTNTIRRASKETQNHKAAQFFQIKDDEGNDVEECLQTIFTNYVLGRFPDIDDTILNRLASSMVLRRKRILYRRSRYGASSIKPRRSALQPTVTLPTIEQPSNAPDVPLSIHEHVRTPLSGKSTTESTAISATTLAADAFRKAAAPSVISVTKTVALGSHEELIFPPAPTGRLNQKYKSLKKQRIENHQTYLQSLKPPARHDGVATGWVKQVIRAHYVDKHELESLLINLFGSDNYLIQVIRDELVLYMPHHLTQEEIYSLEMHLLDRDIGITSDVKSYAVPDETQDVMQNQIQQSAMDKADQHTSHVTGVPYDAEKMEQKLMRDLEKDWIYCCQLIGEITCPFCFYALPSLDVANENKWRAHVKNDLDAYICLFEQCDHAENLYNHSEQWLQHMREHALRWRCTSKSHGVLIFDMKAKYMDHMRKTIVPSPKHKSECLLTERRRLLDLCSSLVLFAEASK
ncbi:hypothetical protein BKA64DRAFT_301951 [Cadophora sp. MPI-SDFR-AT-0126]|nr:hypothetical protein BKA64DRAFT_301951 [Leotiomycetes sp. MPI-SDFR-AT-0126]